MTAISVLGVLRSTAVVLVGITLFSRCLGLVRQMIIASYFGTGPEADAFFAAFRIPDLLFNSLLTFLIGTSVVPVMAHFLTSGDEQGACEYTRAILVMAVVTLLPLVLLLAVFNRELVAQLAPGLRPETRELAVGMTRLMAPIIVFGGVTGAAKAALEARRRFLVPATIPLLFNTGVILAVLSAGRHLGVVALAMGVLGAALAQAMVLLVALGRQSGTGGLGAIRGQREALARTGRVLGPSVLALLMGNLVPMVEVNLASHLEDGAISYLNFANRLAQLPEEIFSVALATVLLPRLSTAAAKEDVTEFKERLSGGMRLSVLVMLPTSAVLGAFSTASVQLLLGRGAFGPESVAGSASVLAAYSLGLVAVCARQLAVLAFFALKDSRTLLLVTAAMVVVNVSLDYTLVGQLGSAGLALGASISAWVQLTLLLWLLRARLGGVDGARLIAMLGKASFATAITALALMPLKRVAAGQGWESTQPLAVLGAAVIVAGVVCLLVWTRIKGREMEGLVSALRGSALGEAPKNPTGGRRWTWR